MSSLFVAAKNKLQEENQLLRDKLQDSELMIRLLKLKLKERQERLGSGHQKRKAKATRVAALQWKVESALRWSPSGHSFSTKKDAFRNKVAPGKRTFFVSPDSSSDRITAPSSNDCDVENVSAQRANSMKKKNRTTRKTNPEPTPEPTMNSVVGKLAEVVIAEYANDEAKQSGLYDL